MSNPKTDAFCVGFFMGVCFVRVVSKRVYLLHLARRMMRLRNRCCGVRAV
ncbi:hypothetical protein BLL52_4325 [Rhodoferax antarcticus ANT.BR]|uniref:Uncharacterized protein n=1 Tax=Rhodoferax antarcticus ANT.BR TaxID=1111071 RepID=A0A1Q8Y9A1_9BURK|nr:hypothetical protein BLL52_4325 [Rhodoferax antarcticus ANT.BR]